MADLDEIRRLAEAAIDSDLAHHSGDVTLDATTFYLPVLDLLDEIERLREALLRVTEAGCDECHEGGCKEFHGPVGLDWGLWCQACLAAFDARAALTASEVSDG